jgi:RimJ/RimL family protein N-acetyltransferase
MGTVMLDPYRFASNSASRLLLSRNIVWIQATTNVRNKASQRILEKADFRIEGTMRIYHFVRGA